MKKSVLMWMFLFTVVISLSSCSDDDDAKFDYPLEVLYGTWEGTDVYVDGSWYDITKYPYTKFAFSIKFNSDGSYSGSGYFGNGSGTYKAEGNTIFTYVKGEEYAKYTVKSLTGSNAELTMNMNGESIDIKARKK